MTSKEIWNFLVDHHAKFYWSNEDVIQREWESILSDSELFGYSRIRGDVDSHRSLQIGSSERVIPDIILRKNNTDLFVIELKKYSLSFSKEREAQLFSYLKLLHISTGVLVCDKIFVYSYDFDAIEQDNILEIPFEKDNKDGIAFVELFSKESFSKEKIKEYISVKKEQDKNVNEIKRQINNQFIHTLLKNHFSEKYSVEEIEIALTDFVFLHDCERSYHIEPQKCIKEQEIETDIEHSKVNKDCIESTNTYDEPDFDYVIIKTTWDRVRACGEDLYEATRYAWKAGDRITDYKYVLSVIDKVVQKVYIVDYWKLIETGEAEGRYEFYGKEFTNSQVQNIIGKTIPYKYRKPGMASPVLYKK